MRKDIGILVHAWKGGVSDKLISLNFKLVEKEEYNNEDVIYNSCMIIKKLVMSKD